MSEELVENACILRTSLGYEDHGILTSYITVEVGGGNIEQAFGGLNLSSAEELYKFTKGVIDTVGVSWEELPGKYVRVKHVGSPMGRIIAIGHPLKDKWYIPECYQTEQTKW